MIADPVLPFWLVILAGVPITIFFLWLEWNNAHRFRSLRLLAVIIMMSALIGILLKPMYRTEAYTAIILLTPGYIDEKVDSIVQQNPDMILMHLDHTPRYKTSKQLPHYSLADRDAEIRVVIGQGIPSHHLDTMDEKVFVFIPSTISTGLTQLFVSPINLLNRKNKISGTFNNVAGNVQLTLLGPGGKEDSILIQTKGVHKFNLSFVPKQVGEFIYHLQVKDSISSMEEIIPVHVQVGRSLDILVLSHYPTFEVQNLKHFLEKNNHHLVLRLQLSKNSFRNEYVNRDPLKVNPLTDRLLENFDLIIADPESLAGLTPAEKETLEKSIRSGLGLLAVPYIANSLPFMPFELTPAKTDTTIINIGAEAYSLPVARFRVRTSPSIIPLQKNKTGIMSGYAFHGAGKIGFQLLQETFRLSLSGDSVAFSELWTPLLEKIARQQSRAAAIKITTPFPWYVNGPIDVEVITSSENISLQSDSIPLPLKEDLSIDNVWHARTWAGARGWHSLTTNHGESLRYYVSDTTEWQSLSLMNQRHANAMADGNGPKSLEKIERWEEIPPLIFYLVFLLSAGFIWLVPKL